MKLLRRAARRAAARAGPLLRRWPGPLRRAVCGILSLRNYARPAEQTPARKPPADTAAAEEEGSSASPLAPPQHPRQVELAFLVRPPPAERAPPLRPYQEQAVAAMRAALKANAFSLLVLPPGAGQLLVANELAHRLVNSGNTVLWLAPSWQLLLPAAAVYARRFGGARALARLGGSQSLLHSVLPENPDRPVQYSTVQTWYRRRNQARLAPPRLALVVLDACHQALRTPGSRAVLRRYLGQVPVLGLAATAHHRTPPLDTRPAHIGYSKRYAELAGDDLATPRLETLLTHRSWLPQLATTGDFSPASLRDLADDEQRNELICRTLLTGLRKAHYSRVLLFACHRQHATRLAQLFAQQGLEARALHQELGHEEVLAGLSARLKAGQVLVTVPSLSHGVQVPEVDGVFLTRPTTSGLLCSRMIGRGAALLPGRKQEFTVVEFADQLQGHAGLLFRARTLLPAPVVRRPGPDVVPEERRPRRHAPPPGNPLFRRLVAPAEVAGLPYVEDQTFGLELEFTSPRGAPDNTGLVYANPEWQAVARSLIQAVARAARCPVDPRPRRYHELVDTQRWHVEFDRSAGWEVVSPILCNEGGVAELVNVLSALDSFLWESGQVCLNHRTGLHLTLGTGFTADRQVQGLVRLVQLLEPGLFTLVSPARLYEHRHGRYSLRRPNKYCRPLRQLDGAVPLGGPPTGGRKKASSLRYHTINLAHLGREDQQVEIRLHHGTTQYPVVVTWLSLWMNILHRARDPWPEPGHRAPVFPAGNSFIGAERARQEELFSLLERVDLRLDHRLRQELARCRSQLLPQWKKVLPRRVKSWRTWWPSDMV